jgi:hypothetical protein
MKPTIPRIVDESSHLCECLSSTKVRNRALNYRPGFRPTFFSQETNTEFLKSALDSTFLFCRRLSVAFLPLPLHLQCASSIALVFVVDGAAASKCTLLHCIVVFLVEIMQVFVHSEVSVLGASVQLQLRHLPSKLSQRSVHYSRVLDFGEPVLNRVSSVSEDAFFKGEKNLRPCVIGRSRSCWKMNHVLRAR